MNRLTRLVTRKVTSDRLDLVIAQCTAFAAGPLMILFGARAGERYATTAAELTIITLLAVVLGLLCITIGLLMPLVSPAWRAGRPQP